MTPKTAEQYFKDTTNTAHKQYEALRAFFVEKKSGSEVAKRYGYALSTFYALIRDFKKKIKESKGEDPF